MFSSRLWTDCKMWIGISGLILFILGLVLCGLGGVWVDTSNISDADIDTNRKINNKLLTPGIICAGIGTVLICVASIYGLRKNCRRAVSLYKQGL